VMHPHLVSLPPSLMYSDMGSLGKYSTEYVQYGI
jgi:hypothetical protein